MPVALLTQAVALASAAGVSIYATVATLGLASRLGWIDALPAGLAGLQSWWVIALAGALYLVEFLAGLIPGVASAWEAVHAAVRPIAGAALAAATAWGAHDATFTVVAGLLGGTLALGTQASKLGARVAIDTSPEPVTNGAANVAELGFVASIALLAWEHPYVALALALVVTLVVALLVRAAWQAVRRGFGRLRGLA